MNNQPNSSSCIRILVLILSIIAIFIFYCEKTFPDNLKTIVPEKFQSHPVKDLTNYIISEETLKNSFYFNDSILSLCQDIQIDKNDIGYCVNQKSEVFSLDITTKKVEKIGKAEKGISYGGRLSRDQKLLYFINSQLGLCEFNIQTRQIRSLVLSYQGKHLNSLNSIETHPTKSEIIYITQTNQEIPMSLHNVDILLNNPLGRVYQFNKNSNELKIITNGLYFPNGLVFQEFNGDETLLIAQSNRFRLRRVYLNGQKRGRKEIAVDKLDMYLDNVKTNEKGQIWIAGPSPRDQLSHFIDYNPWVRTIISRIPPFLFQFLANKKYFGGLKITFSQNKQDYKVDYYLWKSTKDFSFATTMTQKNNRLYLSSLVSKGVLVFNDLKKLDQARSKLSQDTKKAENKKQEL